MGAGSSRARAGGSVASGRRSHGVNGRRRHGRIRPLIRSLSCGTVFPRYQESEEPPAECLTNSTVHAEDEDCGTEIATDKSFHPLALISENGDRSSVTAIGESSQSSSSSGDRLTDISEKEWDSRSSNTAAFCDGRGHYLGESSGYKDENHSGSIGMDVGATSVDPEAVNTHLVQSTDMQAESFVGLEESMQLATSVSEHVLPSPLERGSVATPGNLGEQHENFNNNSNSGASDSSPAEGQLTLEETSHQNIARESSDLREEDSRGVQHAEPVNSSSNDTSSSTGDISSQEARRNSRRRLWDALTRATSRRRTLPPAILLSSEDIDDLGSSSDRWLLDFSGELYDDVIEEGLNTGRNYDSEERRWRFRSQVWALQRLRGNSDGIFGNSRFCASGLHTDGRCSCEAYVMTEETSTRASISRIVMLAEALFEVLDEIHRQSVALSQSTSLSVVSQPAPEAVVDSFPIRNHKNPEKNDAVNEEAAQCYICLSEYDEGDKIRILPCQHEYHMGCIDKWLKEIHRVCPLCRGNVCEHNGSNPIASHS